MYVSTSQLPAGWARSGLGQVESDPGRILADTIEQSKQRFSGAGLFTVALFLGAGWLMLRSGRR